MATSLGGKAHRGMSVPRPHTAFSLCPQPINTESAPKNVVDAVSGCGRAWWQGAAWGGGGWRTEDGFGESEQMCLGTSFWSRHGELGGSGGEKSDRWELACLEMDRWGAGQAEWERRGWEQSQASG